MKLSPFLSILLCCTVLSSTAQKNILFHENFDPPSGPDSAITYTLNGATNLWSINNSLSVSTPNSYKGQVERGNGFQVVFQTDTFSTKNTPYVFLNFNHICKIYSTNQGRMQIWNNVSGVWQDITGTNTSYLGNAGNYNNLNYFNETSYANDNDAWDLSNNSTPTNSWWRLEQFDISDLAHDPSINGYDSVCIRFIAGYIFSPPTILRDGWYIDDVTVIGSSCEQYPPKLSFDLNSGLCYQNQPQGGILKNSSDSYTIGISAYDSIITSSSGIDSISIFYRINNGAWQSSNMSLLSSTNYDYTLPNIFLHDTVDYYIKAWDLACPNIAREPKDSATTHYYRFYIIDNINGNKCGSSLCAQSSLGIISQFPWVEDFEAPSFKAGSGSGDAGNNHRGDFPNAQNGNNFWSVQPNESVVGFAWSVRKGFTGTVSTGPSDDHTANGDQYIYAESSLGVPPVTTSVITPCIDLRNDSNMLFEFYYHKFGSSIGNIRIDIDTGSTSTKWHINYFRVVGEKQKSSFDPWKKAVISLKDFSGQVIKIRLVASKNSFNDLGDIAVDDLSIYKAKAFDARVDEILNPLFPSCALTSNCQSLKISVQNSGHESITNIPCAYQIDGGSIILDTIYGNFSSGDSSSLRFSNPLNINISQKHLIKVWVDLPNDQDRSNDTILFQTDSVYVATLPNLFDVELSTADTIGKPGAISASSIWNNKGADTSVYWSEIGRAHV